MTEIDPEADIGLQGRLRIAGDDIRVSVPGNAADYAASRMSDGERAIFYMIAQAPTSTKSSLLTVDEPELHVHRSIMSRLWDEIEAARQLRYRLHHARP